MLRSLASRQPLVWISGTKREPAAQLRADESTAQLFVRVGWGTPAARICSRQVLGESGSLNRLAGSHASATA